MLPSKLIDAASVLVAEGQRLLQKQMHAARGTRFDGQAMILD